MKQYVKPVMRENVMTTGERLLAGSDRYLSYDKTLPEPSEAEEEYEGLAKKAFNVWETWDDEDEVNVW